MVLRIVTYTPAARALTLNTCAMVVMLFPSVRARSIKLLNGCMTMVTVKPRRRAGSWSAFCRRYEPIPAADGSDMRPWDDPAVLAANTALVWSVVDCDGRLYVVPGFETVNYVGRILCKRPWNDSELTNTGYIY